MRRKVGQGRLSLIELCRGGAVLLIIHMCYTSYSGIAAEIRRHIRGTTLPFGNREQCEAGAGQLRLTDRFLQLSIPAERSVFFPMPRSMPRSTEYPP